MTLGKNYRLSISVLSPQTSLSHITGGCAKTLCVSLNIFSANLQFFAGHFSFLLHMFSVKCDCPANIIFFAGQCLTGHFYILLFLDIFFWRTRSPSPDIFNIRRTSPAWLTNFVQPDNMMCNIRVFQVSIHWPDSGSAGIQYKTVSIIIWQPDSNIPHHWVVGYIVLERISRPRALVYYGSPHPLHH